MNPHFAVETLIIKDELPSTQDEVAARLRKGVTAPFAVLAKWQTAGRGRFGRSWFADETGSLAVSMCLVGARGHAQPWLLGMSVACAAAATINAQIQWPNDLVMNGKKVGGILTELLPDDQDRRVPVIGLGINLHQKVYPSDIAQRATSVLVERGMQLDAIETAEAIIKRLSEMPEIAGWGDLEPIWRTFDATAGKEYQLPDNRRAVALGVGPTGELMCSVDGETRSVMAASAIFGE